MDLITIVFKLSLVGTAAFMDRAHVMQIMISRPLVVSPLIGLLTGNIFMGLYMGAAIELLWIHYIPVGTEIPPDDTILAVLVASVGALHPGEATSGAFAPWMFGFFIFLPAAYISPRMDLYLRRFNNRLWRGAKEAVDRGQTSKVGIFHWSGAFMAFFTHFILLFLYLMVGLNLMRTFFPFLPAPVKSALNFTALAAPVVGIASALTTARSRWALVLFSLSFLALFIVSM